MARPHTDPAAKLDQTIRVRVTATEKYLIWQRAKESGQTPSDFMRLKTIASAPSRRVPTPEREALLRLMAELGKIGSNVNQIARVLNTTNGTATGIDPHEVARTLQSVDALTAEVLILLRHGH